MDLPREENRLDFMGGLEEWELKDQVGRRRGDGVEGWNSGERQLELRDI